MMRAVWLVAVVGACGNPSSTPPATSTATTTTTPPAKATPPAGCARAVPERACKPGYALRICKPADTDRVGEWRYAIAAPPYSAVENITTDELIAYWKHADREQPKLVADADTAAVMSAVLGTTQTGGVAPGTERLPISDRQWAIVPADELLPNWKVVSVDAKHPINGEPTLLEVPLCGTTGATRVPVRNIDPDKLTVLVMTGTTALTRYTAKLMNDKGVLYPLPSVEPWLAAADFVHISNEVSFVPKCDAGSKPTMSFCSKESYIELLEKSHAKIIELDGSHLIDYGRKWVDHTLDMYKERGWIWFGGGHDQLEATSPKFLEHHGNKLAFLGCNMPWTQLKVIRPGAGVGACDIERLQWQIRDLKARGYTPIVSVQHDEVYVEDPPSGLVRDLRAIADAGPIYVMGSQAHCPHPWEVHRGAYVHYGPGNFYFDQFWHPVRDAAQDKLYIHDGKLLTVGHLYTRIEERGRPRVLDARERAELLADLDAAQHRLPKGAQPWEPPIDVPASRDRPDSTLVKGVLQTFTVKVPSKLDAAKRYPLIVDLVGPPSTDDDAFVVTPKHAPAPAAALGPAITAWMTAKYPIDADRVTVHGAPDKGSKRSRTRKR